MMKMMMRKKIKFVLFLALISVCPACQPNPAILNSTPPGPSPQLITEEPKDDFETALRSVQDGDYNYIFAFRRKDGGKISGDDGRFIRANSPAATAQFVLTDEGRVVIAGSNFPFPPENLKALRERFAVEDYSKPVKKEENQNTGNSIEENKNG